MIKEESSEAKNGKEAEINQRIIYVPGLPGNTVDEFKDITKHWSECEVLGLTHAGVEEGKPGAIPDDWLNDVKSAILKAKSDGLPLTIVSHSFGGLFALTALAELVKERKIEPFNSQIRFIAVSAPFYKESSLPDRKPLVGFDPNQPFTFYRDENCAEVMSPTDHRVPMASKYAYESIWQYLKDSNSIKVHPNKDLFNRNLMRLVEGLEENAAILGKTDIPIITLFPKQDRWVSEKAGQDLQEMTGKPIFIDSFDIPSSYSQSMTTINAHDLVKEWTPIVHKYL